MWQIIMIMITITQIGDVIRRHRGLGEPLKQPYTLHPTPYTLNPENSTPNPEP